MSERTINVDYFRDVIVPQRLAEINRGENGGTRNPIYVMYNLDQVIVSGHDEFSGLHCNIADISSVHGYLDMSLEDEERVFCTDDDGMSDPRDVTMGYKERFVAIFLTRKGLEDYRCYQSHNLSKPFLYIHYAGYGNREMDSLLGGS